MQTVRAKGAWLYDGGVEVCGRLAREKGANGDFLRLSLYRSARCPSPKSKQQFSVLRPDYGCSGPVGASLVAEASANFALIILAQFELVSKIFTNA